MNGAQLARLRTIEEEVAVLRQRTMETAVRLDSLHEIIVEMLTSELARPLRAPTGD
jgi:hypothetical protein